MRKILSAIRDGVVEEWMGRIAVVLIIIPVIINIVSREIFKSYSLTIETLALLAYVWIGYGFFGYLYHVDEHLDVKFVTNMFSPTGQKILDIIRDIFCLALSVFLTYWGYKLCKINIKRTAIGTNLSLTIGYASILFGYLDGVIRCFCMLIRHLLGWSKDKNKEEIDNG